MDAVNVEYRIRLSEERSETFDLGLDGKTFDLAAVELSELPKWTALSFRQCLECAIHEIPQIFLFQRLMLAG